MQRALENILVTGVKSFVGVFSYELVMNMLEYQVHITHGLENAEILGQMLLNSEMPIISHVW